MTWAAWTLRFKVRPIPLAKNKDKKKIALEIRRIMMRITKFFNQYFLTFKKNSDCEVFLLRRYCLLIPIKPDRVIERKIKETMTNNTIHDVKMGVELRLFELRKIFISADILKRNAKTINRIIAGANKTGFLTKVFAGWEIKSVNSWKVIVN